MSGASGNVRAGRAFVELMLDQTKLERGLKAAQAKLRNFGNSMTSVGKNLVTVATLAAAPLAYSTKTFADFDDEMRMVKAVTGATEQQFKSLTAVAEELGRTTSFTAKQVAEGMTALGRMGFSPEEIEAAIPAVLNLSRATGTELSEAAEIAANNMRVFGIESSKMASVADILTATANGSAQTLTDLSEGLKMAGPQAAAAGDSITNVSAALGVLANMGIKGSLAGTALRKAYSQFANTKIQAKLKAMGIATTDANGNLRAMPEIMAEIAKAMASMPTAQRLGFAEEIFDLRGSLAGLQLGGNIDQLDEFIKKLQTVNGVSAKTAQEMDSGIGGAWRIFMSAVEGCQIAIGRIIGEALTPYMNKLSAVMTKVAEWIAAHKGVVIMAVKIIAGMLAAGAALITLGLAFKAVALAVGTLSTAFTILKVAVLAPIAAVKGVMAIFTALKAVMIGVKVVALAMWSAISSPAVLVGVALGALIAVVWKLTGAWDICADSVKGMASDFKTAFAGIKEVVGKTWEVIKIALASGDLAGAAKVGLAALKVVWLQGLFPLKKAWFSLKNFLSDSWTIVIFSILKGAYHFWYGMIYGFKYIWKGILKIWYPLVNFLDDSWAVVSTSILKLGNNLWYGLLVGLKYIGNAMQKAWNYIWDGIVTAFEKTVLEIQKAWIRTKGLFDSEDEVNAEIAVVERQYQQRRDARRQQSANAERQSQRELDALNAEWTAANKGLDDAMAAKINQNKARADAGLAEANKPIDTSEWDSTIKGVEDAMVGEIAENQQKYNQAVGEAAAEINAAKAEWQGAMDEVRQRAAEKSAAVEAEKKRADAAAARTEQAAANLSSTSGKSVGAWSAKELDALLGGGGSAQERTAKATEAIVANTKETNRQLKRMKSGSAPAALSYN
jgi:TP901 family phage tail tape measure protein